MTKEKEVKIRLAKLIEKTEEALEEGWIYTCQYKDELQKARQVLKMKKKKKGIYYDASLDFHVIDD